MQKTDAAALFDRIEPNLGAWEHAVRQDLPALSDSAVLDHALRQSLAHLRHEVSDQTFIYLRWRADRAKAAATATRTASVAARRARSDAQHHGRTAWLHARAEHVGAADDAAPVREPSSPAWPAVGSDRTPRTFHAAAGDVWSVREVAVGAVPWAHGSRCLLFQPESAIRRVWRFPSDWRGLPDLDLEALSWET